MFLERIRGPLLALAGPGAASCMRKALRSLENRDQDHHPNMADVLSAGAGLSTWFITGTSNSCAPGWAAAR